MVYGIVVDVGAYVVLQAIGVLDLFILRLDLGFELGCEGGTCRGDGEVVDVDGERNHLVVCCTVLEE